jgi:hypothetical protein
MTRIAVLEVDPARLRLCVKRAGQWFELDARVLGVERFGIEFESANDITLRDGDEVWVAAKDGKEADASSLRFGIRKPELMKFPQGDVYVVVGEVDSFLDI